VERLVQGDPLGGGQHALGLLDPHPAGQRLPQLSHLKLVVGQLDGGADQLGGHDRERPQRLDLPR
jgi:hypothetical protein